MDADMALLKEVGTVPEDVRDLVELSPHEPWLKRDPNTGFPNYDRWPMVLLRKKGRLPKQFIVERPSTLVELTGRRVRAEAVRSVMLIGVISDGPIVPYG